MTNKGFILAMIFALILTLIISILGIKINYLNKTNQLKKDLIEIKEINYFRTEFEYNLRNAIKTNLDNEIKITQDKLILKKSTDDLVIEILDYYNIPKNISTNLLIKIFECGVVNCAFYKYSFLEENIIEKSKNELNIKIGIPLGYNIENVLVIN